MDTVYGPRQPLPAFPRDLRRLAAEVLDRVLGDEWSETWVPPADAGRWLASVKALRDVLDPRPASSDVPLFDLKGSVATTKDPHL